jgi:23S rRNA U2552 (ribose-2'-O)-methylase RlmE/FtsJ
LLNKHNQTPVELPLAGREGKIVGIELQAFDLANSTLRYGGNIILKMLEGEASKAVTKALQRRFVLGFKFKGAPKAD